MDYWLNDSFLTNISTENLKLCELQNRIVYCDFMLKFIEIRLDSICITPNYDIIKSTPINNKKDYYKITLKIEQLVSNNTIDLTTASQLDILTYIDKCLCIWKQIKDIQKYYQDVYNEKIKYVNILNKFKVYTIENNIIAFVAIPTEEKNTILRLKGKHIELNNLKERLKKYLSDNNFYNEIHSMDKEYESGHYMSRVDLIVKTLSIIDNHNLNIIVEPISRTYKLLDGSILFKQINNKITSYDARISSLKKVYTYYVNNILTVSTI